MNSRKALGKGLQALYGENEQDEDEAVVSGVSRETISASLIVPNPFQPRIDFKDETIEELAVSIREQGLLQPLVVRRISSQKYQIISGERRFKALKSLGETEIPAIIRDDVTDKQMLELALVENIQRENLNDIETALSYRKLIDDYSYTHEFLSQRFGKSRAVITNTLRLLRLPETIQQMLRNEQISNGHARALLGIESPVLQLQLAQEIVKKSLSVRDIEKRISQMITRSNREKKESGVLADRYSMVLSEIRRLHGIELKIVEGDGEKGKLEIQFANVEEFEKIIAVLSRENEVLSDNNNSNNNSNNNKNKGKGENEQ